MENQLSQTVEISHRVTRFLNIFSILIVQKINHSINVKRRADFVMHD